MLLLLLNYLINVSLKRRQGPLWIGQWIFYTRYGVGTGKLRKVPSRLLYFTRQLLDIIESESEDVPRERQSQQQVGISH